MHFLYKLQSLNHTAMANCCLYHSPHSQNTVTPRISNFVEIVYCDLVKKYRLQQYARVQSPQHIFCIFCQIYLAALCAYLAKATGGVDRLRVQSSIKFIQTIHSENIARMRNVLCVRYNHSGVLRVKQLVPSTVKQDCNACVVKLVRVNNTTNNYTRK